MSSNDLLKSKEELIKELAELKLQLKTSEDEKEEVAKHFLQQCDQIEILEGNIHHLLDKLAHREGFAKATLETLKAVTKERNELEKKSSQKSERINTLEAANQDLNNKLADSEEQLKIVTNEREEVAKDFLMLCDRVEILEGASVDLSEQLAYKDQQLMEVMKEKNNIHAELLESQEQADRLNIENQTLHTSMDQNKMKEEW